MRRSIEELARVLAMAVVPACAPADGTADGPPGTETGPGDPATDTTDDPVDAGSSGGTSGETSSASSSSEGDATSSSSGEVDDPACPTIAHGDPVSITGSGFGAHADHGDAQSQWQDDHVLAFRFKDMEDGAIDSAGFYAQRGGAPWAASPDELAIVPGGPPGSAHYLRRAFDDEEAGGMSADVAGAADEIYVTFKFMLETLTPGVGMQSGKLFRLYADAPQNNIYLSAGCGGTQLRGFSECEVSGPCSPETEWGAGPSLPIDAWRRVEIWIDASTGRFSVAIDGVVAWEKEDWVYTTLGANGHTIDFPNMIDEPGEVRCPEDPSADGAYAIDDVFVDFTRARIELTDDPVWADSTHREVQLPVTWTDDAITFLANRGAHENGTERWVHVVTASGEVVETGVCVQFDG